MSMLLVLVLGQVVCVVAESLRVGCIVDALQGRYGWLCEFVIRVDRCDA